jgi:hypothetical protein
MANSCTGKHLRITNGMTVISVGASDLGAWAARIFASLGRMPG